MTGREIAIAAMKTALTVVKNGSVTPNVTNLTVALRGGAAPANGGLSLKTYAPMNAAHDGDYRDDEARAKLVEVLDERHAVLVLQTTRRAAPCPLASVLALGLRPGCGLGALWSWCSRGRRRQLGLLGLGLRLARAVTASLNSRIPCPSSGPSPATAWLRRGGAGHHEDNDFSGADSRGPWGGYHRG